MEKFYLILSEGAYSDYSPEYFVGDTEITQEEFDTKGREVGDRVIAEYQEMPFREHVHTSDWCCKYRPSDSPERYNPETGRALGSYPNAATWMTYMKEWVESRGFKPLPEKIPEINTSYSDFPTNMKLRD